MKLTISLVATNEKEVLRKCLVSLREGMDPNIKHEIIVVDNVSSDGTADMLKQEFPAVKMISNKKKKGFCANHNMVIRKSSGEHVLILNPDIVATKGFVDELIRAIEADHKIGFVTGKLYLGEGDEVAKKVIDSTGIILFKNRRAVSRGHNEEDAGRYDVAGEIFASDGAAMLCRREMLDDIKLFDDYFDESFYAFKEDQDLCWRARMRGWKGMYTPKAVAYHLRGWGKGRGRKTVPRFIRQHSFKNRYLMMLKNDHFTNYLIGLPFILWFEFKALIYMIFVEPHLFLALYQIFKFLPSTLRKRRQIMKRTVASSGDIRKWFS